MRLTIRWKLFFVILSILFLFLLVFSAINLFFMDDILIRDYKIELHDFHQEFVAEFKTDTDLNEFIHKMEKGRPVFVSIINSSFKILATSSPGLSRLNKLSKIHIDEMNEFIRANSQDFLYYTIHPKEMKHGILVLAAKLQGDYFLLVERPLGSIEEVVSISIQAVLITSMISSVIGILVTFLASYQITIPVLKINRMAHAIARLDFTKKITINNKDEIGDLANDMNMIAEKLSNTIYDLKVKNEQVLDSINCASKIQHSILPLEDEIREFLSDHFVLWKPRDIVAGDFFWFNKMRESFLIAIIDCTGHGVPGAFMTMMANSVLDRITSSQDYDNPALILKNLNIIIRRILGQNQPSNDSRNVDQGMDMGICLVKPREKRIIYSGAKIPLFHVNNREIELIKGDRQSIGYRNSKDDFSYTNIELQIQPGHTFYLSSDGFIDQIGGDRDICLGKSKLKELLLLISGLPMSEQKNKLLEYFNSYKGDNVQLDDITIIGFKI